MAEPYHCPDCQQKLPLTFAFRVSGASKASCPHCGSVLRPDSTKRSLIGYSAGMFVAILALLIGHLYMIVRESDPLTTYIVMLILAGVLFTTFSISTARQTTFELVSRD